MSPGKRVRMADVVRRRRTPRLDVVSVLAILVPLLTLGALVLVRQPPQSGQARPPALTRLTNATVVCPAATPGAPDAVVSTASGSAGQVSVSSGTTSATVSVRTGAVTPLHVTGSAVVAGHDALAPGLLALRSGTTPLTTQACGVPSADQWFTGLGAGPSHDSVIELVNPDAGPADADITLYGNHAFTARKLHGITIPGHRTVSLDLGAIVPRRTLLSAQVQVTRGRLGVQVLDRRTNLVTHKVRSEWVPGQDAPSSDLQLLGLPRGSGTRTLQVADPGANDVRVQVKVVTGDTSFVPAGLAPVTVPAGSTVSVPLTQVLARALADGAVGVEVVSDGPVVASVLTDLGTDEAFSVGDQTVTAQAATLLPVTPTRPKGAKAVTPVAATLYVSADAAGSVSVTAYDATGTRLLSRRFGEQRGHAVTVRLPRGTAYLRLVPHGTTVRGAVALSGSGASVVPLRELLTRGLVPQIRPGRS